MRFYDRSADLNKIQVLILAAIPRGLRLDKEVREIRGSIDRSTGRRLDLEIRVAVRAQDIRRSVAEVKPTIVHFCGHGSSSGMLLIEDDRGVSKSIHPDALASLFKLHSDYVKCVLINTCHSNKIAEAVSRYIDYAIGMEQEIGDIAAISFSQGFYDALGYLKDIDIERAFDEGCSAISMEEISAHSIPVIKKRIAKSAITQSTSILEKDFNFNMLFVKHISKATALSVITILITVIAINVASKTYKLAWKSEVRHIESNLGFRKYKDPLYRFSVQYPANWEVDNLVNSDLTIRDPLNNAVVKFEPVGYEEEKNVYFEIGFEKPSAPIARSEYATQAIDTLITSIPNIFVVDSSQIDLGDMEAHQLIYESVSNGVRFKKIVIWAFAEQEVYQITFASQIDYYDSFKELVQQMIYSFEVF